MILTSNYTLRGEGTKLLLYPFFKYLNDLISLMKKKTSYFLAEITCASQCAFDLNSSENKDLLVKKKS